jgi:Methyltransferase domain.
LDIDTVEWLNKNASFVDFWNTDKTFDLINISQVYEHLNITDRMNLIKRCHEILNKGGYLLVDFPFTENFNLIFFNKDITHKPVSSTDDPLLIKSLGFEFDFVYLAGMKYKNVLLNIFSLLLFGSYQQTLQIIAKKQS